MADELARAIAGAGGRFGWPGLGMLPTWENTYPPRRSCMSGVRAADSAPTEAEQRQLEKLKRQSGELLAKWEDLQRRDLAAFQKMAAEGSLSTVMVPPAGRTVEEPVAAH